uniref:PBC domain-containing protein n=1 Tax=Monopterus albus TaxID=43700 RepID=A0A3Q3IAT3_MONAL
MLTDSDAPLHQLNAVYAGVKLRKIYPRLQRCSGPCWYGNMESRPQGGGCEGGWSRWTVPFCLSGFLLHKRKHALNWHRMKSAIFSILCEVKEKTGKMSIQYVTCMNSLLLSFGVAGNIHYLTGSVCLSLCAGPVIDQWPVYGVTQRLILSLIPGLLTSPCMQACSELTGHVKNLLREQSRMRPISPKQTEQMVTIIHRKFSAVQLQLKQSTCEAVMILQYLLSSVFNCCNRFFFISTFMLLYAVNQVEFLVISFLLSSLKVANWFGNKRIRYKKNIGKFQEDA